MKKICSSTATCAENKSLVFVKNGYLVQQCETCGHRFSEIADPDKHVAEFYSDDYFFAGKDGYPNYINEQVLLRRHGKRYARIMSRYMKTGRVLDVGCAAGFILKGFEESGWECQGVEPNATMG